MLCLSQMFYFFNAIFSLLSCARVNIEACIHSMKFNPYAYKHIEAENGRLRITQKRANHPSVGTMITTKQSVKLLPPAYCFFSAWMRMCLPAFSLLIFAFSICRSVRLLKTVDADECNNNNNAKNIRKETKRQLLCCVSTSCFVCLKFNEWEMWVCVCLCICTQKKDNFIGCSFNFSSML